MDIQFREKDLDKRDKIVNAALKEFSLNNFEKASTNTIVKEAGVSKGLLYHYFKSKQDLYDYLLDFVFTTIGDGIRTKLDFEQSDFFKRIQDIVIIKMEITNKYPNLYDFGMKLLKDLTYEKLMEKSKVYNLDLFQKVYNENIDYTLFKESIDVQTAMTIIQWTIEKFSENITTFGMTEMDEIVVEMNKYLKVLKHSFYKEEYL